MNITKRIGKYKLILAFVMIFIIAIVTVYTIFMQKQTVNYARYDVEEGADNISKHLDTYINSAKSGIELTAQLVEYTITEDMLADPSVMVDILNKILPQTPFNFMEFINKDGINCTDKGNPFDASNREYYKEGIKGNTGIWINYYPMYSREFLLNFYTPLYYKGDIIGVITGTLGADTNLLPMLTSNFYEEDMIGILLDEKGQLIVSSDKNIDKEAYLDAILSDYEISKEGIREFNNHLSDKDKTVFEFEGKRGKSIACIRTNELTGWRVIQIVPAASFKKIMLQNTRGAYLVMAAISVMLLMFLLYVRIDFGNKNKAIIKEKDKVVADYDQILSATAEDTYKSIRRIDIESNVAEYVHFKNHNLETTEIGSWTEWLESQKKYVHRHDYEKVYNFSCIENLKTMEEGKTYSVTFRSANKNESGFYKHYTSNASVASFRGKKTILMTTIDNTAAVMVDLEQKRLLASAASIYISVHAIDLKKDTLKMLNSAEHISKIVGDRDYEAKALLKDTMIRLTDEQYLNTMLEFIDFETLDERMKGVKTITLEFLGKKSGWCRARFIAVDYDDSGKLNNVLWVVEDIDAEKKKANQLLYMSETDLMTGIRNRGSGEKTIKELLALDNQGMFFLLDADSFKSINDNYGHKAGDKVLIAIADSLKSSFRDSDVVMRLGGDEFAAFAKGLHDRNKAIEIIERFFEKIEKINIPEIKDRKITVSVGIAVTAGADNLDFDTLYKNADSCTYKSKKVKGNSYTFYESE